MGKTLLIMAAGMGSRYGGLKQIDNVGPDGQYLIDYAVYDAVQTGFDQVVFVIREDFAQTFRQHFSNQKLPKSLRVDYVYQRLDDLPSGLSLDSQRSKPWGTGQAVWAARHVITQPFAVISADDFYGRAAYVSVANFLDHLPSDSHDYYGVVGYQLANTISPHGWVARGLLKTDADNHLTSIHEHTKIGLVAGQIVSRDKNDIDHPLSPDRLVSMVMFAFTPDFFGHLQTSFADFIRTYGHDEQMEFFTPNVVNQLIQDNLAVMQVLPTTSDWFGVTYAQDKEMTVQAISQLVKQGVYPRQLW